MSLSCGIIGLPNIGKSTIFNALTKGTNSLAENYPFATIKPHVAIVDIPDNRLQILANISNSKQIINNKIEFVDIAGLVKGAASGEGLGNKFLSNIREVTAICHVVRCFDDENITHVMGKIDPIRDIEIVNTELMLSDLSNVENRIIKVARKAKSGDRVARKKLEILNTCKDVLQKAQSTRGLFSFEEDLLLLKEINLLTNKPIIYVCNVNEHDITGNEYTQLVTKFASLNNDTTLVVSAKIESELALLSYDEEIDFLKELNLQESGLSRLTQKSFTLLNQINFFTSGEKESRAWNITKGTFAPKAAGVIHSDIQKGFIKAEIISYDDFIKYQGEEGSKLAGKIKIEGKDYIISEGDVVHFRFNI